ETTGRRGGVVAAAATPSAGAYRRSAAGGSPVLSTLAPMTADPPGSLREVQRNGLRALEQPLVQDGRLHRALRCMRRVRQGREAYLKRKTTFCGGGGLSSV